MKKRLLILLALMTLLPLACKKTGVSPVSPNTSSEASTNTPTFTKTYVLTHTPSWTPTSTASTTWSASLTSTTISAPTDTFTQTPTNADTSTVTATPDISPTQTLSPTETPTGTFTSTDTPTPTLTDTMTPTATIDVTAFRISSMDLRDPHAYIKVLLVCEDFTDSKLSLTDYSVNGLLEKSFVKDDDSDGELDTNVLLVFKPLNINGSGTLEIQYDSVCTAPLSTTVCDSSSARIYTTVYSTDETGTCLSTLGGTVRPYSPAVTPSTAPCFVSGTFNLPMTFSGVALNFKNVTVAGTFGGNPTSSITHGLIRAFLSKTDAEAAQIPSNVLVLGGKSLSSFLPGGSGNCSSHSDVDTLNGESGWWFYLNFTAGKVVFLE